MATATTDIIVTHDSLEDFLWAAGASEESLLRYFTPDPTSWVRRWTVRGDAPEGLLECLMDRHRERLTPRVRTALIPGHVFPYKAPHTFCGGALSVRFGSVNVLVAVRTGNIRLLEWLSEHRREEIAGQWFSCLLETAIWGAGKGALPTVLWLLNPDTGAGSIPVTRETWMLASSAGAASLPLLNILYRVITEKTRPGPSLLYKMVTKALELPVNTALQVLDWIVRHFGAEFLKYKYSMGNFTAFDQLACRVDQMQCYAWLRLRGALHCHKIQISGVPLLCCTPRCAGFQEPLPEMHGTETAWVDRELDEVDTWDSAAKANHGTQCHF